MRRQIAVCMSLVFSLSLFGTGSAAAVAEEIRVELENPVSYINIEDNNSVTVKITNKTSQNADIVLSTEVKDGGNTVVSQDSANVSVARKSTVYYPMSINLDNFAGVSEYISDNFDSYTDDAALLESWTISNTGVRDGALAAVNGGNALRLSAKDIDLGATDFTKEFSAECTDGKIEVNLSLMHDYKCDRETERNMTSFVYLYSSDGTKKIPLLNIYGEDHTMYLSKAYRTDSYKLMTVESGVWYDIKIIYDTETLGFEASATDGKNTWEKTGTYVQGDSSIFPGDSVGKLYFQTWGEGASDFGHGLMYVDNVDVVPISEVEPGAYTLTVSAQNGAKVISQYSQYLYATNKINQDNDIGICSHFHTASYYKLADMQAVPDAGFSIIRDECRWQYVEPSKGTYVMPGHIIDYIDAANKANVQVLLILGLNNTLYSDEEGDVPSDQTNIEAWLKYVRFVVSELKGKVKYFEVWNEPNHENFSKDDDTGAVYAELLRQTYPVIKDANPEAYVVSGGLSGSSGAETFIREMVAAGANSYMDAFGTHPYCCYNHSIVDERQSTSFSEDIDALKAMGITKPIWITEIGYLTEYINPNDKEATEPYYTEEEKGAYNVRTAIEFKADGRVDKLILYQLKSTENGEKFGHMNFDGTPGPAYRIIYAMNKLLVNAEYVNSWGRRTGEGAGNSRYAVHQFRDKQTGEDIFVMWSKGYATRPLKISNATGSSASVAFTGYDFLNSYKAELNISAGNSSSTMQMYDAYGNKKGVASVGETLNINYEPLYIVCEKPDTQQYNYCDITMENGYINGSGHIANADYVTVRAEAKLAKKTVYIDQIKVENNGEFGFSFKIPRDDVYEIYVLSNRMNCEKFNLGSLDASVVVTVDGKPLNKLNEIGENGKVSATVSVDSEKSEPESLNFIAAVYTYENRLLYTKVKSVNAVKGEDNKGTVEFTATETADWEKLKLFLWDSDSLQNIMDEIEIK